MLFVPHVPPPRPSRRAQELGDRLAETIDAYCRQNPDMSAMEIRQAAQLAAAKKAKQNPAVAVAIAAAIVAASGLMAALAQSKSGWNEQFLIPGIIVLVGIGVAAFLFVLKSR